MNEQLRDYIKTERAAGSKDETIRANLIAGGCGRWYGRWWGWHGAVEVGFEPRIHHVGVPAAGN